LDYRPSRRPPLGRRLLGWAVLLIPVPFAIAVMSPSFPFVNLIKTALLSIWLLALVVFVVWWLWARRPAA
jgi:hypothetical protein